MIHRNRINVKAKEQQSNVTNKNIIFKVFYEYCTNATIHCIRYLSGKDSNLLQKIWWTLAITISLSCCFYLISSTYIKWKNDPIIKSFAQEQAAVWEIPFPAVTICPLNKVEYNYYNYTKMYLQKENLQGAQYKQFWDISLICNLNDHEIDYYSSIYLTDKTATDNIIKAASNLYQNLLRIIWQGKDYGIQDRLFVEQLTHEGLCFTFNSLSQEDMYTKNVKHNIMYINHTVKSTGWNLENGYPDNTSNDYPRRTVTDGYNSGLRIRVKNVLNNSDFICGPQSTGYKLFLHNPAETPKHFQQYFLIPRNKQVLLTVTPKYTTTSENLRSMSTKIRKCYFTNEQNLKYYKVYTQNNCGTECSANITKYLCGCVPFYMPMDKQTPICGFGRIHCTLEAEVTMLRFEMMKKNLNLSNEERDSKAFQIYVKCNCIPACTELKYSADISVTDYHPLLSSIISGIMPPEYLKNFYFTYKITQIEIFFKSSQFLVIQSSELFGHLGFLSNCGGILGLFVGFSLLSLIEIFYYATFRLWSMFKKRENFVF